MRRRTSVVPNTWGQRSANVLLAQADLIVAFGTPARHAADGLQLAGVRALGPGRADRHRSRRAREGPSARRPRARRRRQRRCSKRSCNATTRTTRRGSRSAARSASCCPSTSPVNVTAPGFVCPYEFFLQLSELATSADVVIPCSSGGANSVAMQTIAAESRAGHHHRQGPREHGLRPLRRDRRRARAPGPPHAARRGRRRIRPEPAGARNRRGERPRPEDLHLRQRGIRLDPHDAEELLRRRVPRLRHADRPRLPRLAAAVLGATAFPSMDLAPGWADRPRVPRCVRHAWPARLHRADRHRADVLAQDHEPGHGHRAAWSRSRCT